jgi:hypothetical protein
MPIPCRLLALLLVLAAGCGGRVDGPRPPGTAETSSSAPATPLTSKELDEQINALCVSLRARIVATSDAIDVGASNAVRRRTLQFRLRGAEMVWRAQHNPNRISGLVELWFWMAAVEGFARSDATIAALGERAATLHEVGTSLRGEVEVLARRAMPASAFARLNERISRAAASGEAFTADAERERAIIGDLLEASYLESVVGFALSPFTALRGIGSGADAMAALATTASRAVDAFERTPEVLLWNARLAVIEMEEQDTAREARAALQRALTLVEALPTRLREESAQLIATLGSQQEPAQRTLHELSAAAQALTALNESLQRTFAALAPRPGTAAAEPGRPFDIREYTAALEAARAATAAATAMIETAGERAVPAADAAIARLEAASDRLLWRLLALLTAAALLAAGLIVLHRRLRRHS